jgi:bacillithiol system protein YtxJ
MLNRTDIVSAEIIDAAIQHSFTDDVVIFKHSTRCSISSMALDRLIRGGLKQNFYFLDLLQHRDLSQRIAEIFSVHHESPQLLLIRKGECIFEASHLEISVDAVNEAAAG